MPRTIAIDDRLASRRHIRFLVSRLITGGARQARAAAVAGVGAVALVAPWLISMILANPARPTTESASHAASIFVDSALFVRVDSRWRGRSATACDPWPI